MKQMVECPCCKGLGILYMEEVRDRMIFEESHLCTHCMGRGEIEVEVGDE